MHYPERARKFDREHFYNAELPYLLQAGPEDLLIGGDFNCVLHPTDTTGHFQPSRALMETVRRLVLQDAWKQNPSQPTYMHYSTNGAARLDHIYISSDLQCSKMGIEIIPAAFMDHYTVTLCITMNGTHLKRARGRWKMEPLLITDEHLKRRISSE